MFFVAVQVRCNDYPLVERIPRFLLIVIYALYLTRLSDPIVLFPKSHVFNMPRSFKKSRSRFNPSQTENSFHFGFHASFISKFTSIKLPNEIELVSEMEFELKVIKRALKIQEKSGDLEWISFSSL